jgi:flagellar motor switch protein FliM
MEMPTCLNVLRAEPLQSPWLLEIESAVLFPIISRLLGGGNQVSTLERRTATEIELHLMQQITERFLAILQRAWSGTLDCTFSLGRVETNPRRMQGLAPRDELVLVQLEISFDDVRGSWRQGLPLSALRSSRAPLAQGVLQEADTNDAVVKFDAAHPQQMTGQTHLRALLAQMKISPADFAELAEGDILRTPIEADDGFRIYLDGEPKFMARAGTMQGYKAIEIQQVLKPSSPQDEAEQA